MNRARPGDLGLLEALGRRVHLGRGDLDVTPADVLAPAQVQAAPLVEKVADASALAVDDPLHAIPHSSRGNLNREAVREAYAGGTLLDLPRVLQEPRTGQGRDAGST